MESARRGWEGGRWINGVPYGVVAVMFGAGGAALNVRFVCEVRSRGMEVAAVLAGGLGCPGSIPFVSLDRPRANAGPSRIWHCG